MKNARLFAGEFIGTFMMCFFGIGTVSVATMYGVMTGPFQVGMVWGITIALAIFVTRNLSCAHFNPAVSIAMVVSKRLDIKELPIYIIGQFIGAIVAGLALWILFADSVNFALQQSGMTMADVSNVSSIWCEVFPNTAAGVVTTGTAAFAEGIGVFVLVFVIFSLTESENGGRPSDAMAPFFIGLTVTMIICVVGPLTDAGLNPARDLGPRIAALIVGFGSNVAFYWDAIIVYTIAPILGGIGAAFAYTKILSPLHNSNNDSENIELKDSSNL